MLCLLVCGCGGGTRSVGSNETTAADPTNTDTSSPDHSDTASAPTASQSEREGWYRSGGAKVREGDRAVELKSAVDEAGSAEHDARRLRWRGTVDLADLDRAFGSTTHEAGQRRRPSVVVDARREQHEVAGAAVEPGEVSQRGGRRAEDPGRRFFRIL